MDVKTRDARRRSAAVDRRWGSVAAGVALSLLVAGCAGAGDDEAAPDPPAATEEPQDTGEQQEDTGEQRDTSETSDGADTEPADPGGATLSTAMFDGQELDIERVRCTDIAPFVDVHDGRFGLEETAGRQGGPGGFVAELSLFGEHGDVHAALRYTPGRSDPVDEQLEYEFDADGIRGSIELPIIEFDGADPDRTTGLLEFDLVADDPGLPEFDIERCADLSEAVERARTGG